MMEAGYKTQGAIESPRQSAGLASLQELESVLELARRIRAYAEERLGPVCRPAIPQAASPANIKESRIDGPLPAYFDQLRGLTIQLRNTIRDIEGIIDQVDL